jgi:hypothetical protein
MGHSLPSFLLMKKKEQVSGASEQWSVPLFRLSLMYSLSAIFSGGVSL